MKILFIGPLPDPVTGQSLACRVLLDELLKDNIVDVIDLSKGGFKQGVNSLRRVISVMQIVRNARRMQKRADVVYLTVAESYAGNVRDLLIYGACYSRLDSVIIHLHGGAGLRHILRGRRTLRRSINEFFLRRLGGAIVLGQAHRYVFENAVSGDRIHIVPNFAEPFLLTNEEDIRRKFENTKPLRILFLSNLLPGKGHQELLDAFMAVSEDVRERITIDFAGGFESKTDEAKFIGRLKHVPSIRYHGIVRGAEKKRLLHRAHVLCLPTYYPYEGQPISILEAYASGCAVITTDHSGIRDVFADRINGHQVQKQSANDLRATLERLIDGEGELLNMALTNLREATIKYQVATYNRALVTIFRNIAASSRRTNSSEVASVAKSAS